MPYHIVFPTFRLPDGRFRTSRLHTDPFAACITLRRVVAYLLLWLTGALTVQFICDCSAVLPKQYVIILSSFVFCRARVTSGLSATYYCAGLLIFERIDFSLPKSVHAINVQITESWVEHYLEVLLVFPLVGSMSTLTNVASVPIERGNVKYVPASTGVNSTFVVYVLIFPSDNGV